MGWRDFTAGIAFPPYIKVYPLIFLHIWKQAHLLNLKISVLNQLWISLNRPLRAGGTSLFQLCFHQVQLDAIFLILGLDVLSSQEKEIWNVAGTTLQPSFGPKLQVETCWLVRKVNLHWERELFIFHAFGNNFLETGEDSKFGNACFSFGFKPMPVPVKFRLLSYKQYYLLTVWPAVW